MSHAMSLNYQKNISPLLEMLELFSRLIEVGLMVSVVCLILRLEVSPRQSQMSTHTFTA